MLERLKDFLMCINVRLKLARIAVMLIQYSVGEKKYLAVVRTNWRGKKWSRHFEIVQEVDDKQQSIIKG